MCAPMALMVASMAISAVSAVAQYQDQKKSTQAQTSAIEHGLELEQAATARQYEDIQRSAQDAEAQRHTEYLIDSARLRAVAAESGLAGATQDRVDAEAANNADTDMATLEANRKSQMEQAHTQGVSRTNQANVQLAGIRKPSALGTGLQIAGSTLGAYSAYDNASKPTTMHSFKFNFPAAAGIQGQ